MGAKLVSIITPCYNAEKYLHKLLESVLRQDYKAIEFIVVNDGSTDKSLAILEEYSVKFAERGIKYVVLSKENGGAASAINMGLECFSGDYVTFIDADDFMSDDSISERVSFLEENQDFDAVYSSTDVVDETDYYLVKETLADIGVASKKNLFTNIILNENYIWTPAYLVRSSFFRKVHTSLKITESKIGQNIQLFLPLWREAIVGYIDKPLATIVRHSDSHSRIARDGRTEILREREIEKLYVDTLQKMDIPDQERDGYLELIKQRFTGVNERVFQDVHDGRDELARLYDRDEERFRGSHFSDAHTANQNQLATRMIFSSHSMEKSLSNDAFEIGHGFMVVRLLKGFLDVYRSRGYDRGHTAYINTLSVLKVFRDRHKGTEYEEEIDEILDDLVDVVNACDSTIGGAEVISRDDKQENGKKNFKELAEGRFAVRTYADKPVDKKDVEDVIAIAMKTPTVCNRQPVRVRVMYDKEVIARVLEVQGGIAYYDTPPVLILVTADDNSYVGYNERNQGYIDGGLFAMSILYAFEYKGLAACPLHAMFETERDFKVRGMLDIPDNEKIITFISAGHFDKESGVCKSFRYPVDYIMTEVDKIHDFKIDIVTVDEQSIGAIPATQPPAPTALDKVRSKVRLRTRIKSSVAQAGRYLDKIEYDKADGAILTLTGYFNYGNVIQRYATQEFLRQHGYNFVSYVDPYSAPRDMYRIGRKRQVKTPFRAVKRIVRSQKPYWYTPPFREIYPEAYRMENIINFVNERIWIKPFDPRDNYKNYIVGSDQVWRNWWGNKEILGYYFFNFLRGRKAKKIAYAASFGNDKIDEVMSEDDVEYISPLVQDIDYISVREKSGIDLIKQTWGVEGVQDVIDPTLLLNADDYSKLIDNSSIRDDNIHPIFTYILGETQELNDFVEMVQDMRQQPATRIRAHGGAENDILPPVELWLKGFRDAELVVTNSFHGMMFSVVNNTDFIIIGRKSGGLSRIKDFLSTFGLEDRFVDESSLHSVDEIDFAEIDWERVNEKLEELRAESGKWLIDSVSR